MAGIDERVKEFLESWKTIRENTLLSMDLRCVVCDREIDPGRTSNVGRGSQKGRPL